MIRVLNISNRYNLPPSKILNIEDGYTAFCLDEACSYIVTMLEQGKKPRWREDIKSKEEIRNSNFELAKKLRKKKGGK